MNLTRTFSTDYLKCAFLIAALNISLKATGRGSNSAVLWITISIIPDKKHIAIFSCLEYEFVIDTPLNYLRIYATAYKILNRTSRIYIHSRHRKNFGRFFLGLYWRKRFSNLTNKPFDSF